MNPKRAVAVHSRLSGDKQGKPLTAMDLSRRRKRVAAGLREALPGLQTRRHVTAYRTAEYVQAPGPRRLRRGLRGKLCSLQTLGFEAACLAFFDDILAFVVTHSRPPDRDREAMQADSAPPYGSADRSRRLFCGFKCDSTHPGSGSSPAGNCSRAEGPEDTLSLVFSGPPHP